MIVFSGVSIEGTGSVKRGLHNELSVRGDGQPLYLITRRNMPRVFEMDLGTRDTTESKVQHADVD